MSDSPLLISAVIPAAGLSTRMHKYKPLLKLGKNTIIEKVIHLFQQCGIKDIIVVTGHNRDKIEPFVLKTGVEQVFNPNFKTGMLGSIQTGVKAVSPQSHGFFLLPVDIPLIRPSTIHALVAAFMDAPHKVIIPEFNGEPGHPPLIPAWLIPEILCLPDDSNLGTLLLSKKEHQKRVGVHDRGVLMDADTKVAYNRLKTRYQRLGIPDIEECRSIIRANFKGEKGDETIKAHVNLVAETAVTLARAVQIEQKKGQTTEPELDINLIMAGALLHDIKRKERHHAAAGSRYLSDLDFPMIADITAQHMDLKLPLPDHLTETQIVYFADKLCNSTCLNLDFEGRFKEKIKKVPQAKSNILRRYEHARYIQLCIEKAAGRSIQSILSVDTELPGFAGMGIENG